MTTKPPEKIGESRSYWTHKVDNFPSPVAQFRMSQLIDLDDRLYETARVVYRFMVGWYHDGHGDALLSQRHVAKVMKQRAPDGAVVPSRNAVQRAILALMDAGWVVRSFQGRGKGRGASRYVPVMNVLELAAQGKFPQPAHSNGPVELAHSIGPLVARANGPVDVEPAHSNGPKTLLPDPSTDAVTGNGNVSALADAPGGAAMQEDFERLWKAYGKYGSKEASRKAFNAISDPNIAHMIERASAWATSAKPGQRRMSLEKWLIQERYDEADRKTVQANRVTANTNEPPLPTVAPKPSKEPFKPWRKKVRIVSASDSTDDEGHPWIEVTFEFEDGGTWDEAYCLSPGDDEEHFEQEIRHLQDLFTAADLPFDADAAELLGARLELAQFSEYGREQYCRIYESEEPRLPAEDVTEPDGNFDMSDFIKRAKRITGEAA